MTTANTLPQTKRHTPDLVKLCKGIATLARVAGAATHAVLINANMTRVTLPDLPRGGTLLVIRFPTAAIARNEQPLQELLGDTQPPATYNIHAQGEILDGAGPAYCAQPAQRKEKPA